MRTTHAARDKAASLSALIGTALTLMLVALPGARAGTYTFASVNKDGNWSDTSTNGWNAIDYPHSVDDVANILIAGTRRITNDVPDAVVGTLRIGGIGIVTNSSSSYPLTFDVSSGSAWLERTSVASGGTTPFTVPIVLNDPLIITNGSTYGLTLAGPISGAGGITLNAAGGGVTLAGPISVSDSTAIHAANGSVVVGAGSQTDTTANAYGGLTWVSGGTLTLSKWGKGINAIGGDLLITDGAAVWYAALGGNRQYSGEKIPDAANVTVSNANWRMLAAGSDYVPETISNLTLYGSAVTNLGSQNSGNKLQMNGSAFLDGGSAVVMASGQGQGNTFSANALTLSDGSWISGAAGNATLALVVNGIFTINQPSTGASTAAVLRTTTTSNIAYLGLNSNLVFNGSFGNANPTIIAVDTNSSNVANCYVSLTAVRTFQVTAGSAPVDLILQPRVKDGGILKSGNGTLQLTGTNSTYTLGTTVNQGRLLVNGTLSANSNVIVNAGGIFGGTGVVNRAVVVNDGGVLEPGSLGLGTLTLTNLTLGTGAVCNVELGPIGASDQVIVGGALSLRGTVNVARATGFAPGSYAVMTYGTLTTNTAVIGAVPQGCRATLVNSPGDKTIYINTTVTGGTAIMVR